MSSLKDLFNIGLVWTAIINLVLTIIGLVWIFTSLDGGTFARILFFFMVIVSFTNFIALLFDDIGTKKSFLYAPLVFASGIIIIALYYNFTNKHGFSKIATFIIGLLSMIVIVIDSYLLSFPVKNSSSEIL